MSMMGMNSSGGYYPHMCATNTVSYAQGVKQSEAHRYEFDITEIVSSWRRNPGGVIGSPDRGIVFKAINNSAGVYKTFGSCNRASYNPVFRMEYVGYNEQAYSYSQFDSLVKRMSNSSETYTPNCLGLALYQNKLVRANDLGVNDITTLKDVRAFASKIVKYVNDGKCP